MSTSQFDQPAIPGLDEESWSQDIIDDIKPREVSSLVVYSRDWTVQTIASQIKHGNIDLNPGFQRGNAWDDRRRSRLIESLIVNFPVPEIVLAEKIGTRQSFIVLDGKQRLLTIAGFMFPEMNYWVNPTLVNLRIREDLNGVTFKDLESNVKFKDQLRQLLNADVRCTIIGAYESDDLLYEIFHRLNTTSVPLNAQELRHALYRGPFADYLVEISDGLDLLEQIIGPERTDIQARDADLVLRFLSFTIFGQSYRGNLKEFLDESMQQLNEQWEEYQGRVRDLSEDFKQSISRLIKVFGKPTYVGRKFVNRKWESRFNKVLFEVEAYYFMYVPDDAITLETKTIFVKSFKELCENSLEFRTSIESTTKTPSRYEVRFRLFRELINNSFQTKISHSPVQIKPSQPELLDAS